MSEHFHSQGYTEHSRRLPESEATQGFSVEELAGGGRAQLPVEEAFVNHDEVAEIIAAKIDSGEVPIDEQNGTVHAWARVRVSDRELASIGLADSYKDRWQIELTDNTEPELQALISKKGQDALAEAVTNAVRPYLDRDYAHFPNAFLESAAKLSQIFTVDNGRGGSFRIFNFTDTTLGGRQLSKMLNALREMDDLTGGASTEDVQAIGIFSKDAAAWKHIPVGADEVGAGYANASATGGGAISLNEELLLHAESPEDGLSKPDGVVSGNDIEVTLFHELTHVVENRLIGTKKELPSEKFGWKLERSEFGFLINKGSEFTGDALNPSHYGRVNAREDVAESAAAIFSGGHWNERLDDGRKRAIAELFADRHAGNAGPAYLRCMEVSVAEVEKHGKLGSHLRQKISIKPHITYDIMRQK